MLCKHWSNNPGDKKHWLLVENYDDNLGTHDRPLCFYWWPRDVSSNPVLAINAHTRWRRAGTVFSRKLRYIEGFGLVEMASRPIRSLRYIVTCTRIRALWCIAIRLSIALARVQRTPQKRDRDARCGDEDYPKTLDFLFIHWPPIRRIL